MNNTLIFLLAGSSKRFNNKTKKQYITINQKPLYSFSLDVFIRTKKFNQVILVIDKKDISTNFVIDLYDRYSKYFENKCFKIVYGGKERYNSVYNALKFLNDNKLVNNNSKILIHDSARPFIKKEDIIRVLDSLEKYKSISLSHIVTNTIKQVKNLKNLEVDYTPNRNLLYEIYTPQGFIYKYLYDAYNKFMSTKKKNNITDDLQIIELYSKIKSHLIIGDRNNIKITYKNDINILKNSFK